MLLLMGLLAGWAAGQLLLPWVRESESVLNRAYVHMRFRSQLENCLRSLAAFRTSLATRQELDPKGDMASQWQAAAQGHWIKDDGVRFEELGFVELDEPLAYATVHGYLSRSGMPAPKGFPVDSALRGALLSAHLSKGPRFVGPVTIYSGTAKERPQLLRVVLTVSDGKLSASGRRHPKTFLFATIDFSNTGPRLGARDEAMPGPPVTLRVHLGGEAREENRVAQFMPERVKNYRWAYAAELEPEPFLVMRPIIHQTQFTFAYYRNQRSELPRVALGVVAALATLSLVGVGLRWRSLERGAIAQGGRLRAIHPRWQGVGAFVLGFAFTVAVASKTRANAIQADEQRFGLRANEVRQLVLARMARMEQSMIGLGQAMRQVDFSSIERHRDGWFDYVSWMNLKTEGKGLMEVGLAEVGQREDGGLAAIPRLWRLADDKDCLPQGRVFANEDAEAMREAELDSWLQSSLPSDLLDCRGNTLAHGVRVFLGLNPKRSRLTPPPAPTSTQSSANRGFVYGFIDLQKAMEPERGDLPLRDLSVTIHCTTSSRDTHLLARLGPAPEPPTWRMRLLRRQSMLAEEEFLRRGWKFRFEPTAEFYTLSAQGFEWVVLLVGTALSALAGLSIMTHAQGQRRAEQMNERLRHFRASLNSEFESRRRMEMNIHDHPLQELHVAQMSLAAALQGLARAKLPAEPGGAAAKEALGVIQGQVDFGLKSLREAGLILRQIVWEQAPPGESAAGQLEEFRASLSRHFCGDLRFEIDPETKRLDPGQVEHLVALVKEACYNALKHASPARLLVRVSIAGPTCQAVVENDGAGFATESPAEGRGLGNMRSRARALNGKITWASSANGPTVVSFQFPIGKPEMS